MQTIKKFSQKQTNKKRTLEKTHAQVMNTDDNQACRQIIWTSCLCSSPISLCSAVLLAPSHAPHQPPTLLWPHYDEEPSELSALWASPEQDTAAGGPQVPSAAWHTAAGPMPVWVIQTNIIHRLFKQIFLLATQCISSQQIPFASFKFDKNVSGHSLSLFISHLSLPGNASLFIPRPW